MAGKTLNTMEMRTRLGNIRALLMDVDGVLTDGRIIYATNGEEIKAFDVKDGYGITLAREDGLILGIVTGRTSGVVQRRADELGITDLFQGAADKTKPYEEFKAKYHLNDDQVAYIGDDLFDLPVLELVGFAAAPRDAHPSVRNSVHYVTRLDGGRGAVREVIDLLLASRMEA